MFRVSPSATEVSSKTKVQIGTTPLLPGRALELGPYLHGWCCCDKAWPIGGAQEAFVGSETRTPAGIRSLPQSPVGAGLATSQHCGPRQERKLGCSATKQL